MTRSGWPALPIAILLSGNHKRMFKSVVAGVDNVIATALEHNALVFDIKLHDVQSWQLERFAAAMQIPFPELTSLDISAADKNNYLPSPPVLPDSFLGGSAPRLQTLRLDGIPFRRLVTKLLLSSHNLVDIELWDISFKYFGAEEMATCLSPMKRLRSLHIKMKSTWHRPPSAGQHPPSFTCIVLPALTSLKIHSSKGFLDNLVSRLDVPLLEKMEIWILEDRVYSSELPRFISRIEAFKTSDQVNIHLRDTGIQLVFSSQNSSVTSAELTLTEPMDYPSTLSFCSSLPPLSHLKCLTLREHQCPAWDWDLLGNASLHEIFDSFTAVRNVFISKNLAENVSSCMGEDEDSEEEETTEMLPALQNIFVEELQRQSEYFQQNIQRFIAAKRLAGQPVNLRHWEVDG